MAVLTGTVVNGVVVLKEGEAPPDGTEVRVHFMDPLPPDAAATEGEGGGSHAWLLKYAGTVPDLPPDFAAQHDHYIHGTPKR